MRLEVDLSKKYALVIFIFLLVVIGSIGVYAVWDANKKVYHNAGDVKVSIGGTDYNLQEAIDGGLIGGGSGGQVSNEKNYVFVDVGADFNRTCPTGMVVTGIEYDKDGDAHITGILCSPLQ